MSVTSRNPFFMVPSQTIVSLRISSFPLGNYSLLLFQPLTIFYLLFGQKWNTSNAVCSNGLLMSITRLRDDWFTEIRFIFISTFSFAFSLRKLLRNEICVQKIFSVAENGGKQMEILIRIKISGFTNGFGCVRLHCNTIWCYTTNSSNANIFSIFSGSWFIGTISARNSRPSFTWYNMGK